jgi:dTDP-4-amino-4,6-dideoxygalactose transaminase
VRPEVVPFLDVKGASEELQGDLLAAADRVIRSGSYVLGEEVERFETEFAAYVGARHCIGVGNGLDALHLSLRAAGIGAGDEVIVPTNTYIATWLAVTYAGATPVAVEPDPATWNLDAGLIERALTRKTRAIVPVHLYGQPADMTQIRQIAHEHGLFLLDDAAQAHGSRWLGQRVGGLADATAWSFYPSKNLGALGDAGAVTTDDDEIAETVRMLRNYGTRTKYENELMGYNSRLDELQAALLMVKLPMLDKWNDRRRAVAERYRTTFETARVPLVLPTVADGAEPVWHLFVVRTPERDRFRAHLADHQVATGVHYPIPPYRQHAYAGGGWVGASCEIAEAIHREVVSLPIGPHLSPGQIEAVLEAVISFRPITVETGTSA